MCRVNADLCVPRFTKLKHRHRHRVFVMIIADAVKQGFMQDENVACHDIGKLSFERTVDCFGTPQLERATRFPMPQLERATRFPNIPSRVATRFRMFPFEHE